MAIIWKNNKNADKYSIKFNGNKKNLTTGNKEEYCLEVLDFVWSK